MVQEGGDAVKADEPLVELETDKVTVEVHAPAAGVLGDIVAKDGETVALGARPRLDHRGRRQPARSLPRRRRPKRARLAAPAKRRRRRRKPQQPAKAAAAKDSGPAVARLAAERGVDPSPRRRSDRQGRPGDQGRHARRDRRAARPRPPAAPSAPAQPARPSPADDAAREERVRMTQLRQTIARRLKEAQNTAAMLTTFNEVDMSAVMELRKQYKDLFEKKHGVKLGFMSFFVKACVPGAEGDPGGQRRDRRHRHRLQELLPHRRRGRHRQGPRRAGGARRRPAVARRDREGRSPTSAARARDGKLSIDEMQGGTFTITNGGVYGSLMSTPILNAPQSGILGMHNIEERPVVRRRRRSSSAR